MIEGASPVTQALLGTLMTWGLTALGAAVAFFIKGSQVSQEIPNLIVYTEKMGLLKSFK